MKPPSPLLGFNNNVRHKGRVFHIQTEDSGVRHPHIITHLFADGGRILKTTKTSYAEFLDSANMGEVVRQMMQDQHKAMFMALRDGQFDHLLEDLPSKGARSSPGSSTAALGAVLPAGKAAPELPVASKAAPVTAPVSVPKPDLSPPSAAAARPAAIAKLAEPPPVAKAPEPAAAKPSPLPEELAIDPPPPAPPAPPALQPPPRAPTVPIVVPPAPPMVPPAPPMAPPAPAARDGSPSEPPPPPRAPVPSPTTRVRVPSPQTRPRLDIDPAAIHRAPAPSAAPAGATLASVVETAVDSGPNIDLGTLERAAAEAEAPLFQQIHGLPPPPAAVLGARAPTAAGGYSSVAAPAPPPAAGPPSTRGRYAASRPSSIFSTARPQEGASIFGEDLISEKSLDEVILSYLAEDLDGPGEKK